MAKRATRHEILNRPKQQHYKDNPPVRVYLPQDLSDEEILWWEENQKRKAEDDAEAKQ